MFSLAQPVGENILCVKKKQGGGGEGGGLKIKHIVNNCELVKV